MTGIAVYCRRGAGVGTAGTGGRRRAQASEGDITGSVERVPSLAPSQSEVRTRCLYRSCIRMKHKFVQPITMPHDELVASSRLPALREALPVTPYDQHTDCWTLIHRPRQCPAVTRDLT